MSKKVKKLSKTDVDMKKRIQIISADHHRNGVCGKPFYPVLFWWKNDVGERRKMYATLTEEEGDCCVADMSMLMCDDVSFGSNSFRGDHFQAALLDLLKDEGRM